MSTSQTTHEDLSLRLQPIKSASLYPISLNQEYTTIHVPKTEEQQEQKNDVFPIPIFPTFSKLDTTAITHLKSSYQPHFKNFFRKLSDLDPDSSFDFLSMTFADSREAELLNYQEKICCFSHLTQRKLRMEIKVCPGFFQIAEQEKVVDLREFYEELLEKLRIWVAKEYEKEMESERMEKRDFKGRKNFGAIMNFINSGVKEFWADSDKEVRMN